jgi:two-component system phosphate regulon sensor histidine kinase PhoR
MKRRRLVWTILPYLLGIVVVSLTLAGLYASREMHRLYFSEVSAALEGRAKIVANEVRLGGGGTSLEEIDARCDELGVLSDTRFTITDSLGVVLGDSEEDPLVMGNHATRPEIAAALRGDVGIEKRYSNTLQRTMIYVAVPVKDNGRTVGVVRAAQPLSAVEPALTSLYNRLAIVGLLIAVLATLVGVWVLRRQTRHLQLLKEGAQRFAAGNLNARLKVPDTEEIAGLAESMNDMAAQLDARIRTVVEQRNEREAVFSSMSEGIVALDADDHIVSFNRAAEEMLSLNPAKAAGQSIYGLVRISALHELIRRMSEGTGAGEAEITFAGPEDRIVLARTNVLLDAVDARVGTVLVLNDITRQKKLESVRRDFVANVSHELKTPITAIRGSVETLLDGALENEEDARRFVTMIDKQSARLAALLEDLLSLARIENSAGKREIRYEQVAVKDVIQAAVQACAEQAGAKGIKVEVSCPPELRAELDRPLMDQAIVNLIDNAVRYSEGGTTVAIDVSLRDGEVAIAVRDQGCGIEARHLPRLFERFYRVDSARSRATGGTGLGLSIVKHVALAHGGRVDVVSTPGKGSTFTIMLPLRHS